MSDAEEEAAIVTKKSKPKQQPYILPLYAEQPTIVWDRVAPILRTTFQLEYGLNNTGIPPKSLKLNVHVTEEEVESLFGKKVGGNGYRYANNEDEEFVKKVERRWMICHQRTSVPNTRLVNISEARGWTYELLKGKPTNWVVHAEWTCRQQLATKIKEEEERVKQGRIGGGRSAGAGGSSLGIGGARCALGGGQNSPAPEGGGGSIISCEDTQRGRSPHKLGFPADSEVHSMAIGEWQEYVSSLEKETPGLDAHVKRLYSEFEAAKISLAKVAGQLDYGRQLVSNAKIKLRELEAAKETNRLKLEELRGATESDDALISAMATEGEALQWKLDSQESGAYVEVLGVD
jgi:hypothetical protein